MKYKKVMITNEFEQGSSIFGKFKCDVLGIAGKKFLNDFVGVSKRV